MGFQGVRRLLESSTLAKPSASKMWVLHWLLGIVFYLAVGISVWIEGAGMSIRGPTTKVNMHWKGFVDCARRLVVHQLSTLQHHPFCTITKDDAQHPSLHPRIWHPA